MGAGSGQSRRALIRANFAPVLLTRDAFRDAVFERDGHRCVVCSAEAVDAHHIIERRLWPDGGYYLENGVGLCAEHHLQAEQTLISPEELRQQAGIARVVLPPQFSPDAKISKWGDETLPNGQRLRGELFDDESVQKALRAGGVLDQYTRYVKYPRTFHIPGSPGAGPDDLQLADTGNFEGKQVVITEKIDGESTAIYSDYVHARSIDSGYHPSRTWVKQLQSRIGHDIPEGWRVCGESVYAQHSIHYDKLPSYFMLFSIWNEKNECLSWEETKEWAQLLGLETAPVLYEGPWDEKKAYACYPRPQLGDETEGFVVRNASGFTYASFRENVAKFVRHDHTINHSKHWMHEPVTPNELLDDTSTDKKA